MPVDSNVVGHKIWSQNLMFIVKIFLPSVKIHKKALTSKEDLFVLFSRSPTETTNMAFTIVLKWLYLFQLECLI